MPIYIPKYRGFTADTGCTLDWQIGFEDRCGNGAVGGGGSSNSFEFLGINKKKREKEARSEFPAVTTCTAAQAGIAELQSILADKTKQKYKIAAYQEILAEYVAFYNSNCIGAAAAGTATADPVLQSAYPGSNQQPATGNQPPATGNEQANGTAATGTKLPSWLPWAAGGAALIGVIVFMFAKKK